MVMLITVLRKHFDVLPEEKTRREVEGVRKEREQKLIRCGREYDALAVFSLTHGGRPSKLSHPRRRPKPKPIPKIKDNSHTTAGELVTVDFYLYLKLIMKMVPSYLSVE